jgi:hypothetical protein
MCRLRPAMEADFPAIKALIHQVGINPMGLAWPNFILAVDEAGAMVGWLHNGTAVPMAAVIAACSVTCWLVLALWARP